MGFDIRDFGNAVEGVTRGYDSVQDSLLKRKALEAQDVAITGSKQAQQIALNQEGRTKETFKYESAIADLQLQKEQRQNAFDNASYALEDATDVKPNAQPPISPVTGKPAFPNMQFQAGGSRDQYINKLVEPFKYIDEKTGKTSVSNWHMAQALKLLDTDLKVGAGFIEARMQDSRVYADTLSAQISAIKESESNKSVPRTELNEFDVGTDGRQTKNPHYNKDLAGLQLKLDNKENEIKMHGKILAESTGKIAELEATEEAKAKSGDLPQNKIGWEMERIRQKIGQVGIEGLSPQDMDSLRIIQKTDPQYVTVLSSLWKADPNVMEERDPIKKERYTTYWENKLAGIDSPYPFAPKQQPKEEGQLSSAAADLVRMGARRVKGKAGKPDIIIKGEGDTMKVYNLDGIQLKIKGK